MAKKRGNGEGSVYPRRNKYGKTISWRGSYVGFDGKRRYVSGKTRREAEEKLTEAKAQRNGGLMFDAGTITLGEYLKRWLKDCEGTVSPRTWERYEQNSRIHIVPELGRVKLKALAPIHLRSLYRQKLDAGLAPRTVGYVHQTLHKALKQAVADGLVGRNVAAIAKAPRPQRKEMRYLDLEQVQRLLDAAKGDRLEALYVLAITTGMRQGEILGLCWQDVNLDASTLEVRRTLSSIKGGIAIYKEPKSGKGRSIRLSGTALEALRRHRASQNEEHLKLVGLWEDHGLVFPGPTGEPMRRWTLDRRSFTPLLECAELSGTVTFHGLRHTCATLMLKGGIHARVVQDMLGHADVALTLNVYSHVLPNMQEEAARRMDELLT